MNKLHLPSGDKHKQGWVNVDIRNDVGANIVADILSDNFWNQIPDNSVSFIYSEHFIEHVSGLDGKMFIGKCYKKLRSGGVLRIATPDLTEIVSDCYTGNWKNTQWLKEVLQGQFITTMAEYLNIGMRDWDHKFLYDEDTLKRYALQQPWQSINKMAWGCSVYGDLQNLETRMDSKLIIECVK